jgi:KaiC/GvpD/RAD55 family RecA-like ATPase
MKSSLSYYILYQNAIRRQFGGLYMTLEQSRKDLEEHMEGLGMDRLVQPDLKDRLAVVDLGELRGFLAESGEDESKTDWFRSVLSQLRSYREEMPLDLFVLDSVNAMLSLHNRDNSRSELFRFIRELKTLPMTTFLISEAISADTMHHEAVSFLSDGIIRMEAKRFDEVVNLQLGIVKMRKTSHDRSFMPFIARKGHLEVVVR